MKKTDSKRKMTQAIIDEQDQISKQKKDIYDFLEDDDDFEEFEIAGELQADQDDYAMVVDTNAVSSIDEKKMWQEDWDDEEVDDQFSRQLRTQLNK